MTSLFSEDQKAVVVVQEKKVEPIQLSVLYQELSNPTLAKKYDGQEIEIEAAYLGLWNDGMLVDIPKDTVAINHREKSYQESITPLGTSDAIIPSFAIAYPSSNSPDVLTLKVRSIVRIKGKVLLVKDMIGRDAVLMSAMSIKPV